MNYYERIQKSIDYIEDNINNEFSLDAIAREAFMSLASFYRLFFAIVGYPVKEYIRLRRISIACYRLRNEPDPMIDIAFDSGFGSQEAFIKMFKRVVGKTPGSYKKGNGFYEFPPANILDRYYDIQDPDMLERYPEIKVLKDLKPVKVAYYRHISKHPELDARNILLKWMDRISLDAQKHSLRFFGFNNPCPSPGKEEYGYEVWVTIDDSIEVEDEFVKEKTFQGGSYAVTGTTVKSVEKTWIRINEWLKYSKYTYNDDVLWLEELLVYSEIEEDIKLDIYIPIKLKTLI